MVNMMDKDEVLRELQYRVFHRKLTELDLRSAEELWKVDWRPEEAEYVWHLYDEAKAVERDLAAWQ